VNNIGWAFALTVFAGAATLVGGAIGVLGSRTNRRFLSMSLGLSGGMMVYISFVELWPVAREDLARSVGAEAAEWWVAAAFFVGVGCIAVIDFLIPDDPNPHMAERGSSPNPSTLKRAGILTGAAIAIHNFPEGIATFLSAARSFELGLPVAVAVALHNIPEGVAVAVPIHHAGGSKLRAMTYAAISGFAEPLGALLAFAAIEPLLDAFFMGFITAAVAGIMVFISIDTLIPNAKQYEEGHDTVYGLIIGMALMAGTLLVL